MAHNFKLVVKLVDVSGEKTTKTYLMRGYLGVTVQLSFDEALTDAQDLLSALDNASGAQIVEASLNFLMETEPNIFSGLKLTPDSGSDVTDVARFQVYLESEDTEKTASHDIPAPKPAGFLGTTGPEAHIVDITWQYWLDYFNNFAASPGGEPQISDGENVDTGRGSGGIFNAIWASRARSRR